MDPCQFVRILIGNLALKFPISSSKPSLSRIHPSTTSCYCKIKLKNFPDQLATVPLLTQPDSETQNPTNQNQITLAACFTLDKVQIEKIVQSQGSGKNKRKLSTLSIRVYSASEDASFCGIGGGEKLLGKVYIPLDLRGSESRASVVHNGWVGLGESRKRSSSSSSSSSLPSSSSAQLYLSVKIEPDPRFVFQFGGEPVSSPQVFQVQGNHKQAVFTCKFGFRNSCDRMSSSSSSEQNKSMGCFQTLKSSKDHSSKERKGWSVTIHDLSGSPVAMASMVTPFVPSPGSDRVSRSNPGAWLILRPGCGTWSPWGRLEAWRQPGGSDALGYRFDLFHDTIATTATTTTIANSTVSTKHGGKFAIDMSYNATYNNNNPTPLTSPNGSFDLGSISGSDSRSGSRPGSGSGSDFGFLPPQPLCRGFVMSSTVEGLRKSGKPEVEVGVQHVTCTEDAAAFVALAAAMDLSMDACRLFSHKLRKEFRQHSKQFYV